MKTVTISISSTDETGERFAAAFKGKRQAARRFHVKGSVVL